MGQGGLTRTRHTLQNEDLGYGHARHETADIVDLVVQLQLVGGEIAEILAEFLQRDPRIVALVAVAEAVRLNAAQHAETSLGRLGGDGGCGRGGIGRRCSLIGGIAAAEQNGDHQPGDHRQNDENVYHYGIARGQGR